MIALPLPLRLIPRRWWPALLRQLEAACAQQIQVERANAAALRHRVHQLEVDVRRIDVDRWAAWAARDEAVACNDDLWDRLQRVHGEKTRLSLALHGHGLPWDAGDYTARDYARDGKTG